MKSKDQLRKELDKRRRLENRERVQQQREEISGMRHPGGLLKTETERWNDLHPDDLR
jgi:hypothetical protein